MSSKTFSPGTVIDSNWLNDVNVAVYETLPTKVSSISPTLTTPNIGNATASTVNKITFTQPATGATLTIPDGATATVSGVNTGDQNLTGYAQYGTTNVWTGSNTFNGTTAVTTLNANTVSTKVMYNSALLAVPSGGTVSLNASLASTFAIVITANTVISISNPPPSNYDQTIYIKIVNGGAFTTAFAAGTKYPSGAVPTLTSSGFDLLSAWYDPFNLNWVVGMVWKDYK